MYTKNSGKTSTSVMSTKNEEARLWKKLLGTMSRSWDLAYSSIEGTRYRGPYLDSRDSFATAPSPLSRRKSKLCSNGIGATLSCSRAFRVFRRQHHSPDGGNGNVETGSATISPTGNVTFLFTRRVCQASFFRPIRGKHGGNLPSKSANFRQLIRRIYLSIMIN